MQIQWLIVILNNGKSGRSCVLEYVTFLAITKTDQQDNENNNSNN